ncbi:MULTISPECIES: mismatch-specific DNA-glycosylase [Empedobacter]|uniref:Mismatch-specific DNA-glycosylase n=1 Tax=Empedobacter falsenii TaxID=343874 RepID=A0AAW7DMX6_9FLAO|nr:MULTISPECIES: mismatch-specific DNA-glycosylase [Empedobacter]MCA4809600.1 mismatch-specific DNA-glycosylase [Empedobacter stercoris]MDM1551641.1 mismatch-specific DNA-glycosylase [Empedobacter falsenii]QNT13524.1 mismatch-specific DNA-glycosylase [Empedobacter stercoris]
MEILKDLLKENLDIVFCGTAVGNKSAKVNAYYAGNGNQFYSALKTIGLTNELVEPQNYKTLLDYKIGLTDLIKTDFGNDNEIDQSTYDVKGFLEKINLYKPKLVVFNGKEAGRVFLNKTKTSQVNFGLIEDLELNQTKFFIAPSTSGSARGYWDISIWEDILNHIK